MGGHEATSKQAWCRTCAAHTRQSRSGGNGDPRGKEVYLWHCAQCMSSRIALADCMDFEAMVKSVLDENVRRTGSNIDLDDALSRLMGEGWDLWRRWDPEVGVPFLAYGVGLLRLRAANYYRDELGRNGKKAHGNAISLNATVAADSDLTYQGQLEAEPGSDPAEQLSPDLEAVLNRGPASRAIAIALEQARRGELVGA